ncbi:MAG: hypothetical protein PWR31_377 [Bacillota bacterium]|nr:hypothetical protein [Bacillota bacterium]
MPRYGLFLLAALLSLSLVVTGCTAPAETPAAPESPAGRAEVPAPNPEQAPPVAPVAGPAAPQPGPGTDVGGKRLYFRLWGTTPDLMYLVPVTVEAPHPEDMPQQALALLLTWPDKSGATVSLWPAGTKAALRIKDGTATVDFTSLDTTKFGSTRETWALDGDKHWGGSAGERLTIEAIVHSLGAVPGVKQVEILIEGQRGATIGGHVILDRPTTPGPLNILGS